MSGGGCGDAFLARRFVQSSFPRLGEFFGRGSRGCRRSDFGYLLQMPPPPIPLGPVRPHFGLEISPDPVRLGILDAGQSAEAVITIRNPTAQSVSIDRVETSCPCIETGPARLEIAPGEIRELTLKFDASTEPEFGGALSVEVAGYGESGRLVLRARVLVEVRADVAKASQSDRGVLVVGSRETGPRRSPR